MKYAKGIEENVVAILYGYISVYYWMVCFFSFKDKL